MSILTLFQIKLNKIKNGTIIYGPQQIPEWHPLSKLKCWRCGWYQRKLILYEQTVINIIIYRFYCPETRKTYSLLPFFISQYERHINTTIEHVITAYFLENTSVEDLATEPTPSPWTIRRWLKKFQADLAELRQKVEEFLIGNLFTYRPTAAWNNTIPQQLNDFLAKTDLLPFFLKEPYLYGRLSYLNYATAVQAPGL
jgi:hypothetical protein